MTKARVALVDRHAEMGSPFSLWIEGLLLAHSWHLVNPGRLDGRGGVLAATLMTEESSLLLPRTIRGWGGGHLPAEADILASSSWELNWICHCNFTASTQGQRELRTELKQAACINSGILRPDPKREAGLLL